MLNKLKESGEQGVGSRALSNVSEMAHSLDP